ncbi:MAG: EAL domain-containing protein [Rhodospirillales bacterium]|nr:EAL domain-containing protein [Rhodospirillales bacterium]
MRPWRRPTTSSSPAAPNTNTCAVRRSRDCLPRRARPWFGFGIGGTPRFCDCHHRKNGTIAILSDALTRWVLTRAIEQAGTWRQAGTDLQIAVNVSALNLHDLTLPDRIIQACQDAEVLPSSLTLELTETATMSDAARMMEILTRFRLKGFKLSIDDFGTGYSSLMQLQRLPFSEVKIDKSFVMSMHDSPDAAVIVRAITDLGHNLGLSVVAEGVESEAALKMLSKNSCDIAQGYFISGPSDGAVVSEFASRWQSPAL